MRNPDRLPRRGDTAAAVVRSAPDLGAHHASKRIYRSQQPARVLKCWEADGQGTVIDAVDDRQGRYKAPGDLTEDVLASA